MLILALSLTLCTSGLLLFMGAEMAPYCAVGTAVITGLNAFARVVDYSGKQERHALSMKEFSSVQRTALTLLTAASEETQNSKWAALNDQFGSAHAGAPPLTTSSLECEIDDDGEPIFKFIIEDALISESDTGVLLDFAGEPDCNVHKEGSDLKISVNDSLLRQEVDSLKKELASLKKAKLKKKKEDKM